MCNAKLTYTQLQEELAVQKARLEKLELEHLALKKEQEYYRLLADYSTDMVALFYNGLLTYISPAVERLLGYTPQEFYQLDHTDLFHPDERQQLIGMIAKSMQNPTAKPYTYTYRQRHKKGHYVWLEAKEAHKEVSGKELLTVINSREITDRKEAEEALRESEERFKALFTVSPDTTLLAELDSGIIVNANQAATELFEKPIDEIIGLKHTELHPPDYESYARNSFSSHSSVSEQEFNPVVIPIIAGSGAEKLVEIRGRRVQIRGKDYVLGVFRNVTIQKAYQEALEDNEHKLSVVFNHNTDAQILWVAGPNGEFYIEAVNDTYIRKSQSFGFDINKHDLIGKNLEEAVALLNYSDDYLAKRQAHYQQIVSEGQIINYDEDIEFKTGWYYSEVTLIPIFDQHKKCQYILFNSHDITERKRVEATLKTERDLFTKLMDSIPDKIYFKDLESRFIRINKIKADQHNLKDPSEAYGKTDFDFYAQEHAQKAYNDEQQIIRSGLPLVNMEEVEKWPDGRKSWLSTTKMPLRNEAGKVIGTFGISRDITTNKQFEKKLKDTLIDLRLAQEIAKIGNWSFDPEIGVPEWSEEVYKIYDRDLKLGPPHIDDYKTIYKPRYYKVFITAFRKAVKTGKPFDISLRLDLPEGKVKWIHAICLPDKKPNTKGRYFLRGTIQDVTRQKQTELALVANQAHLKEINATKDRFFSIISHDLRSPFNAILGFSELLNHKLKKKDYEKAARYGLLINQSAEKVMGLLINLLEWSRVQTGRIRFKPDLLNLYELIEDVVMLSETTAREKKQVLSQSVLPDLTTFADKNMLHTIIRNLVSNAVKFTADGGEININARKLPDGVEISVADTGVGITEEDMAKLFQMDTNVSQLGTRKETGTGLGLVLCHEFVKKHGGKIWVESTQGKGSVFYVHLPDH